jgi:hypothetical protein
MMTISITGIQELAKKFRLFPTVFRGQLLKAANESGRVLKGAAQARFGSSSLKPNAAKYLKWKLEQGFSGAPLTRTFLLRQSVTFRRDTAQFGGFVGISAGLHYPGWLRNSYKGGAKKRKSKGPHRGVTQGFFSRRDTRPLNYVMGLHEEGKKMPHRPVFAPTAAAFRSTVVKLYIEALKSALA